jgi:ethanolamine utilization microcompartment shell protein EutL
MIFTGDNLKMVRRGIDLAVDEIHNQIATCPDVNRHAAEIEELEAEQEKFKRLLARIDAAIEREGG